MVNNRLDLVYFALSDPSRRGMVERLQASTLSISELGAPLGMTLAAIGKHVAVLESAGIVQSRKTGRVRMCSVVPGALTEANSWMTEQRSFWNDRVDALAVYLEENP